MCGPCFSDLASCIRWPLWPKGPRHRSSPTGTSHENGSEGMAGTKHGCCCRVPGLPFVVYEVGLPWRLLLNGWQARGPHPSLTDVAPCVAHAGSRPCGEPQCVPLPRIHCRASPTEATPGRLAPDYAICGGGTWRAAGRSIGPKAPIFCHRCTWRWTAEVPDPGYCATFPQPCGEHQCVPLPRKHCRASPPEATPG